MKLVLSRDGVKREITTPFQLCASYADLKLLRDKLNEILDGQGNRTPYGWHLIYEKPRVESVPNEEPRKWAE